MNKFILNAFELCVAVLALVIVSLFCYYISPQRQSDIWSIITAIATVAAVVVALSVALTQGRTQRKRDDARGRLMAGKIHLPIEAAQLRARELAGFFDTMYGNQPFTRTEFIKVFEQLDAFNPDYDIDTLQSLEPLRDNCAHLLAAAISSLDSVKLNAKQFHANFFVAGWETENEKRARMYSHHLYICEACLNEVAKICESYVPDMVLQHPKNSIDAAFSA